MRRIPAAAVLLALAVAGMCLLWLPGGFAERSASASLLIVADEQEPMNVLAEFLRDRLDASVQVVDQAELPSRLDAYAAVFMYIHGAMGPQTESALLKYARDGGRLVILHHGIASARRNNPEWLAATGIYIAPRDAPAHPWRVVSETTHTVVNLAPEHYITTHEVLWDRRVEYTSSDVPSRAAEFPAFALQDTEVFLNQHFTDGRAKTVLLGFRCTDPQNGEVYMQDRSGWYKPFERGWIFYYQPGHRTEDFRHPAYLQILLNTLRWRPS